MRLGSAAEASKRDRYNLMSLEDVEREMARHRQRTVDDVFARARKEAESEEDSSEGMDDDDD